MQKLLIITVLVVATLVQSCSSSNVTKTSSKPQVDKYLSRHLTPVIDGKAKDWGDTMMFYDPATKIIYSIANDESNLYFFFRIVDQFQQMKIIEGGMEIWVDDKMKHNKKLGVKYPLGGKGDLKPGQDLSPDTKQMRQMARLKMLTMELRGFRDEFNGKKDVYSDIPVKAFIDWDSKGDLIYELSIPFDILEPSMAANMNNLSIGFIIKGISMDQGMGNSRPEGGPPGGMPRGGMRPPGGANGSMPDRSQMENIGTENSFWTKYTLFKSKG